MATQNNLTIFAGDGQSVFNWQVFQNNVPFNLTGVAVFIALKGASDMPDPTSAPDLFSATNGLQVINALTGQGIWTLPASYANEPSSYWWHGTVVSGGVTATWGFGTLTVAAV